MRWIIAASCMLLSSLAYTRGDELASSEYRRPPYTSLQVTDIFGAAQLIKHLLAHSHELKELLEDPMDIFRATIFVGTIAAVVKVTLMGVQSLSFKLPELLARMYKLSSSWLKKKLHIPEGFDVDQLIMCEQMFEQSMITLCEQRLPNNEEAVFQEHWDFQRQYVQDLLYYIVGFLLAHQQYYRVKQIEKNKKGILSTHAIDNTTDHICFMVDALVRSLRHVIKVCQHCIDIQKFDEIHIQKIASNILVLFKQLRRIIDGGSALQTEYQDFSSFGQQAFMPPTHFFDVLK
ncbi:MAG: hypothetical protein WD055_06465 [Candidatus Dependentiae bacterium]